MSKVDDRAPRGAVLVSDLAAGERFTPAYGGNYVATGRSLGGAFFATKEGATSETCFAGRATVERKRSATDRALQGACSLLARHATTLDRANERECSEDMTDAERARHDRAVERTEARVRILAGEIGALAVRFNGDPRGAPFKLTLPTGRGNGMGGDSDGWNVLPSRCYK